MEISIIHPTRSRPQKSFETITKWIMKAGAKNFEIIVSVDVDDPTIEEYRKLYRNLCHPYVWLEGHSKNAVEAVNSAAKISSGNILIIVSDDTDAAVEWSTRVLRYTEGKNNFVLKTRDGIQPKMITMPILDRVYYQLDGFIYHPRFKHAWADRFLTDLAHKRGRVITKNILFKHLHYSVLKNKKRDAQYARTDATFEEGRQVYKELKKEYGIN